MNKTLEWLNEILPEAPIKVLTDIARQIDIAEQIAKEMRCEVERLRGVIQADGEQQAAHIRGLNESWESERELLVKEIEQLRYDHETEVERLTQERDAFMDMAERLTADLEALRCRVFVRR